MDTILFLFLPSQHQDSLYFRHFDSKLTKKNSMINTNSSYLRLNRQRTSSTFVDIELNRNENENM